MNVHTECNHFMMIGVRSSFLALSVLLIALAMGGCGESHEPRFAEVTVSNVAPSATLSGTTRGIRSATDLSPGCPGYLDPDAPEHIVRVSDETTITLRARSSQGPLALAVVGDGEVRCDSDGGSGHAPQITLNAPGEYAIHVGSLNEGDELPYELAISKLGDEARPNEGESVRVSITITSEPSGATVRTTEGRVVGTTPAMFTVAVPQSEIGQERRYLLDMEGRGVAEVSGRLLGGAVVLHAAMPASRNALLTSQAPNDSASAHRGELVVRANSSARIRDHQVARQSVEVESDCTIERTTVDVDIVHSYIADLRVVLRSPAGTSITLHDHGGGAQASLITSYDWDARRRALHALAGQNARGRWEMSVHDDAGADTGTFRGFTLHLSCREASANSSSTGEPAVTHEAATHEEASENVQPSDAATPESPRVPRPRATPSQPRVTRSRVVTAPAVVSPRPDPLTPPPPQPWQSPSTGRSNSTPRPIAPAP
jgi:subtilisin-like proprotein convertase family protein